MRAVGMGSGSAGVREPAREVISSKPSPSRTGAVDDETLIMPPEGSVGPADRGGPGRTSGA
jgi:hypothetical protein